MQATHTDSMILVTGGTGFIGRALIRHLVEEGREVRTLIRPGAKSPNLPRGVPVEVAISSVDDERSLRSAMAGIDTVYHLVGGEWRGASADLRRVEVLGTQTLIKVAQDSGVERIFYLSHLGADRASGYPVLKAKGIAEEFIKQSGMTYTILRCGLAFGENDQFTTALARLFYAFPIFFPVPGDGEVMLQPLWVEDLVTCLAWSLENEGTRNATFEIGGPEALTISQVVREVMGVVGVHRRLLPVRPAYMRIAGVLLEYLFPQLPLSVYWIDYLASNRTTDLDTVPRVFGLMPARFSQHLGHLRGRNWRRAMLKDLFRRRRKA